MKKRSVQLLLLFFMVAIVSLFSALYTHSQKKPGTGFDKVSSQTETLPDKTAPLTENSNQTDIAADFINICKNYSTTGMSLAVFKGQDIIYSLSYGTADKAAGIAANIHTKYRIASISKTITAILAMQLVSEGKLDLDADISDYIGFKLRSPAFPETAVTTRHLLTHTSGIFDSNSFETAANTKVAPSLEYVFKSNCHTGNKPGNTYLYSNLGAGIVSGVIEGAANARFYDYAETKLFDLLGLDAAFIRTQISDTDNIAQIYSGGGLGCNVKTRSTQERYANIPIGQMYLLGQGDLMISAVDLAKFGIILAGNGTYNGIRVLPADYVDEMNRVQFRDNNVKRGLALSITDDLVSGREMRGHPGQAYGMVAGLYYDPDDQTGIAFLTNGCSVSKNSFGIYEINDAIVKYTYQTFFTGN